MQKVQEVKEEMEGSRVQHLVGEEVEVKPRLLEDVLEELYHLGGDDVSQEPEVQGAG